MTVSPHPPTQAVRDAVARALAEDVLPMGDLTASLLVADQRGRAALVSRAEGVIAGRLCADEAFRQIDPSLVLSWEADDGDTVGPGSVLGRVEGPLASILTAERTALNFLCHLSGIATLTARYVASAAGRTRILDTRKTTPGLRALEKAAVRAGGGSNHRGSLSEFVLVKDNHLAGMSITAAVERARRAWPARTVEVECDCLAQVKEAVAAGADIVMLDNMTPEEVAN
jgi:nicotinate-nucleotide pyrophosphorylase (carboxylating)